MRYIDRQDKLQNFLAEKGLDAFLVRKKQNIAYLTGIKGDDARLFVSPEKNILFTDSRYKEEYKKSIRHCALRIVKIRDLYGAIEEACSEIRSKAIGFEANNFTYSEYVNLKKGLKNRRLVPLKEAVENFRMIKDREEIGYIRQACIDGSNVMNYSLSVIKPGRKENDVKADIEAYAIKNRLKLADFDIIAASGKNSSMPHASCSDKIIKRQEMVIIDLGAKYRGYNSDLTRTVFLGRINRRYSNIYKIVLDAQKKAIEKIKPGVCARDIDAVSREYISKKGMGRFFLHSLGHGIGAETHEIPAISQNSKIRLAKGMVFTVEPGIYINRWGGVRIEDVALVTENGCEILTKGAKSYAGWN